LPPPQTPPPFAHARVLFTQYPVSEVNAQPEYTLFTAAVTDIGALRIRCGCQTKSPHPKFRLGPSGLDLRPYGPQRDHCATSARAFGPRLSVGPRRYAPRHSALWPSSTKRISRNAICRALHAVRGASHSPRNDSDHAECRGVYITDSV